MIIRTFSDPVLRRVASPIRRLGADASRLAARMVKTMRAHRGVGLAAPQVGVSRRLIIVDTGDGLRVLVNPKITRATGAAVDWEGCLSFPGLLAEVERAQTVGVEGLGLDGRPAWIEAEDFLARVLQHELDHLDGVVILDRARSVERVEPSATSEAEPTGLGGPPGPGLAGAERIDAVGAGDAGDPGTAHPLRVAFLGTPGFACPTLESLVAAGHAVVGVATQPDRPGGRGGHLIRASAVKQTAQAFGLPVWQGEASEAKASLAKVLAGWRAEVAVVVAYGVILPEPVLAAPRLGCLNLHASLLPDYRGAAPVQRAILDGRSVTGVTVIKMDAGVDTGDILAQREVPIGPDDTGGTLHDKLAAVGAELVLHTLELLGAGTVAPRPQPSGPSAPAPRLGPEDEIVDWRRTAAEIERQVRALLPEPGAYTLLGERRVKVLRAAMVRAPGARGAAGKLDQPAKLGGPGTVVGFDGGSPVVATGKGLLALRLVQPAGGTRLSGPDFVNGYRLAAGDRFGDRPSDLQVGG